MRYVPLDTLIAVAVLSFVTGGMLVAHMFSRRGR